MVWAVAKGVEGFLKSGVGLTYETGLRLYIAGPSTTPSSALPALL